MPSSPPPQPSASRGHRDPVDRAHLTGVSRPSPPIHRYQASPALVELVQRYWIPVWSLTSAQTQSTLQYPTCLVVISNTYARFYGPTRGCSSITLEGDGWAVGAMLRPAAGYLLLGRPVASVTDRFLDLTEVSGVDVRRLIDEVHDAMQPAPNETSAHVRSIAALESRLAAYLPVDHTGLLANRVVDLVAERPELTRVSDLATAMGITERSLQRLVDSRIGLTPKWLIQRRRLHDAVEAIKAGGAQSLANLAADLGYADQAHFTHDFRTVTGMTPGEYLADQPR